MYTYIYIYIYTSIDRMSLAKHLVATPPSAALRGACGRFRTVNLVSFAVIYYSSYIMVLYDIL